MAIVFWLPPRPANFRKELSLLESLCEKFFGGDDGSSFRDSSPIPRSTSSADLALRRLGLSNAFSSTSGSSISADRVRLVETEPRDDRLDLRLLSFLRKAGALATLPPLDELFLFGFELPRKSSRPAPSESLLPARADARLFGVAGLFVGDDGSTLLFNGPTELDRLLSL